MATTNTSTLTRKGQVTIPAHLREKLGLQEGDRMVWWEENGLLQLTEAREYVRRMTAEFKALAEANPNRPSLTDEQLEEAIAEAWTERYRQWLEKQ